MATTAFADSKNSTIVRSNVAPGLQLRVALARTGLQALSRLAPPLAERFALRRFGQPGVHSSRVPEVPNARAERSTLRVGGEQLAIYSWGQGPSVLLVHGFGGSAAQLARFVPPLLQAGMRVVAFDQPAHGQSSGRYAHLMQFARAVRAVAEMSGARAAIAHSLGATATAIAHSQGLPLERAVLIAPPGNVPHFARAFAAHIGLPSARVPGMLHRLEREFGVPLAALDVTQLRAEAPAALLIVHDAADAEVPYAHGRALAEHWPNAVLQTVHGLGHRKLLRDARVIDSAARFVARSTSEPQTVLASQEHAS